MASKGAAATVARQMATVAIAAVLATACGSSGDSDGTSTSGATGSDGDSPTEITIGFLDGEWRGDECNCTLAFENGNYQVIVLHLNRELRTVDRGGVTLSDGLMTFTSDAESTDCEAGEAWVARYSPLRPSDDGADRIQLSPVSEDCEDRGRGGLGWYEQLTRVP